MRFRKLRIAWSVGCGIACVLLIVLWVRSYWWQDILRKGIPAISNSGFYSGLGTLKIGFRWQPLDPIFQPPPTLETHPFTPALLAKVAGTGGFGTHRTRSTLTIRFPHWFAVFVIGVVAAVPWVRRFTLRTLLIATTLAAMVLGLIAYASRL
jgi:hypothetical protein